VVSELPGIAIYGAGQAGVTIKECIELQGKFNAVCFMDDDNAKVGEEFSGLPVYSGNDIAALRRNHVNNIICGVVDHSVRIMLVQKLQKEDFLFPNIVHPSAFVSPTAALGFGNFVKARSIIETKTVIGNCCIIDNGVTIAHDNRIADGCHLAPGVSMGSNITIGEGTIVGTGASISTRISIGANVVIVPGASVLTNVDDNSVMGGVPARVLGKRK